MLLDHDGHLPSFAGVSEGKQHEVRVARQLHLAPGTILAIDRGYTDYPWFADLTKAGVYFVARLKFEGQRRLYGGRRARTSPTQGVRRDQVIFFYKLAQAGVDGFFRHVVY